MKPETKDFLIWLEQKEKDLTPRISNSKTGKWKCYSLDVTEPYENLPEWLHNDISEMESEETRSREFWLPNCSGIGKLVTEDWNDFVVKWKYRIKEAQE